MKIAFYEVEDWEKPYIKEKLKGHNLLFFSDILEDKNTVWDSDIISVFIYSEINKKILSKFKKLKAVVTRSTGYDHIDIKSCKEKKILVSNVPSYGENTVAEHTFALILDLSRKIHQSHERTVRGNFSIEGLRGFDLKGKTLGIVGMGHIGQHVAKIAKGFEMNVLVNNLKKDNKLVKKFGFKYVNMNILLKNSDIITLHCPYNKQTHHLINKNNIELMKKGAYLINTARGGIIDTTVLVKALTEKRLGGVGLDVLEEESLIKEERELLSKHFPKEHLQNLIENHILLTFDNVIITPHNAFNSQEALQRILDTTIENIKCLIKGNCKNLVK